MEEEEKHQVKSEATSKFGRKKTKKQKLKTKQKKKKEKKIKKEPHSQPRWVRPGTKASQRAQEEEDAKAERRRK